jgi:Na+-translocating ferredoxin:NAD+ oxidoreductase subunit G
MKAMVGFKPDGTIIDVVHLEHKETPGLGDKIEKNKSTWSDQYKGKHPETFNLKVTKDGGELMPSLQPPSLHGLTAMP